MLVKTYIKLTYLYHLYNIHDVGVELYKRLDTFDDVSVCEGDADVYRVYGILGCDIGVVFLGIRLSASVFANLS